MNDFEIDQFLAETNALDDSIFSKPSFPPLERVPMGDSIKVSTPCLGNHFNSSNLIRTSMPTFMPNQSLLPPSNEIDLAYSNGYLLSNSMNELQTLSDQTQPSFFSTPINGQVPIDVLRQNLLASIPKQPLQYFPTNQIIQVNNSHQLLLPSHPNQTFIINTNTQIYQLTNNFNIETQIQGMGYSWPSIGSSSKFAKTLEHVDLEFANTHAYSGHKSSHSKKRREMDLGMKEGETSKKTKLATKKASPFSSFSKRKAKKRRTCKGKGSDIAEIDIKKKLMEGENESNKSIFDQMLSTLESEDSVNSELRVGDHIDCENGYDYELTKL